MKKLTLIMAVALVFALTAFAQTYPSGAAPAGTQATGTAADIGNTLTGCLAKDAAGTGFMLTNRQHEKGVEIKSSQDLSAHVGHKVKLSGSWEPASAGAGMRTFNVTKVDHLSATCGEDAGAMGEEHRKTETKKP